MDWCSIQDGLWIHFDPNHDESVTKEDLIIWLQHLNMAFKEIREQNIADITGIGF